MMVDQRSNFERLFESCQGGHTLKSSRTQAFDTRNGLFYSPLEYESIELPEPELANPDEAWIRDSFLGFVRAEFSTKLRQACFQDVIQSQAEPVDFSGLAQSYRDKVEQELVYAGSLESILDRIPASQITSRLYAIICSDTFGDKRNEEHVPFDLFENMLKNIRVGLRMVVPGLPFRDQNRIRTEDDPHHITFAEVAFLVRLHTISLAFYQALPTGADIVVLSDGRFYSSIFGIDTSEASAYLNGVRQLRSQLNMTGTVSIIDLMDAVEKYDNGSGAFNRSIEHISRHLRSLRNEGSAQCSSAFDAIENGIRWNSSSRLLSNNREVLKKWLEASYKHGEFEERERHVKDEAVRYAAVNLALKWHDVVSKIFPSAVRATMHAKPRQIALPRFGSCFPWNGVALCDVNNGRVDNVEVHSLSELCSRKIRVARALQSSGAIAYYVKEF